MLVCVVIYGQAKVRMKYSWADDDATFDSELAAALREGRAWAQSTIDDACSFA